MSTAHRSYRANEFAEVAGVTVRALHHYDRLGLLKARRNGTGYRLYSACDLERLEQIVALKFVGLPLKQIKTLLGEHQLGMRDALRLQRRVLEEKRRLLDTAINAIREAEQALRPGERPDSAALKKIIEVIEMQGNPDWLKKYYSEEARAKIDERKQLWSPELQERVSKEWSDLFRDVEAALDEDPASARAQALADRWAKLVEGFTGGDREIAQGLNKMYNDRPNWPTEVQQQMAPFSKKEVWDFIGRAFQERKPRS